MSIVLEQNGEQFERVPYGRVGNSALELQVQQLQAQVAQTTAATQAAATIDNLLRNSDFAYSTLSYAGTGAATDLFGWVKGANAVNAISNASTGVRWDNVDGWLELSGNADADDLSYNFAKRAILPGQTLHLIFNAKLKTAADVRGLKIEYGIWDGSPGIEDWVSGSLVGSEASNAPVVSVVGATGTTTYKYRVVAVLSDNATLVSDEASVTTGAATLTTANYNQIAWVGVAGAVQYRVYRTDGPTTGLIADVRSGSTSFKDQGTLLQAGAQPPTAVPPQARRTASNLEVALTTEWATFALALSIPGSYALRQTQTGQQWLRLGLRGTTVPTVLLDRIGLSLSTANWAPALEDRQATGDIDITPSGDNGQGGIRDIYNNYGSGYGDYSYY